MMLLESLVIFSLFFSLEVQAGRTDSGFLKTFEGGSVAYAEF